MGRDTIQLENAVSTISQEYLLEFTFEYGIPESLHPEFPSLEDPIVEFPKVKVGVYTKFFEFANFHSYSVVAVATLNTRRTPIQKQPEALLCLVGLSRNYFLRDDVYLTFLYDDDWDMDLFNLISAPNPTKVKTGTRPHAAHEVPLLTTTAIRVIDMGDTNVASGSSGTHVALEKSPLDFADEDPPQVITERGDKATAEVIPESSLGKEVGAMGLVVNKRGRKRGNEGAEANASPKVLRKDHVASRPL
nr:transposase (putative), gypsy type [Tanacetum cinerariifolium]